MPVMSGPQSIPAQDDFLSGNRRRAEELADTCTDVSDVVVTFLKATTVFTATWRSPRKPRKSNPTKLDFVDFFASQEKTADTLVDRGDRCQAEVKRLLSNVRSHHKAVSHGE